MLPAIFVPATNSRPRYNAVFWKTLMAETIAPIPPAAPAATLMEQIVSLCKRRGFIYPASEIYGGIRGFWDYGPLGTDLKNNIRDWWWRNMVEAPPLGPDGQPIDMVG